MGARVGQRRVDGQVLWCVAWESSSGHKSAYWYFDRKDEALLAHQHVIDWERGQPTSQGERGERRMGTD